MSSIGNVVLPLIPNSEFNMASGTEISSSTGGYAWQWLTRQTGKIVLENRECFSDIKACCKDAIKHTPHKYRTPVSQKAKLNILYFKPTMTTDHKSDVRAAAAATEVNEQPENQIIFEGKFGRGKKMQARYFKGKLLVYLQAVKCSKNATGEGDVYPTKTEIVGGIIDRLCASFGETTPQRSDE